MELLARRVFLIGRAKKNDLKAAGKTAEKINTRRQGFILAGVPDQRITYFRDSFFAFLGGEVPVCHIYPKRNIMDKSRIIEENTCPQCGRRVSGRPDKVFCSDACRYRWHYRQSAESRHARNRIITSLSVNYRILDALLSEGTTSADLCELEDIGFKPSTVTSYRRGRHSFEENGCFDIRYCRSESKIFNIRKSGIKLPGLGRDD